MVSYVFVSTPIRLVSFAIIAVSSFLDPVTFVYLTLKETGPCRVGDEASDEDLMEHLDAKLVKEPGANL